MSSCAPVVLAAISRSALWYLADLPYPLFTATLEDAMVFTNPDKVLSLRRRYLGFYAFPRGISTWQAIAARTGLACVRQLSHLDYQPSPEKPKPQTAKRLHAINVDVIKRATMVSAPAEAPKPAPKRRAAAWVKVWSSERDDSVVFVRKEDARKHFGPTSVLQWLKLFRKGQVPEGQVPEAQTNKEWRNL